MLDVGQTHVEPYREVEMEFLIHSFMGTPVWMWLSFLGIVALLLAADLGL